VIGARRTYTFYRKEKTTTRRVLSVVRWLVFIVLLYALITTFLVSSYVVETETMSPLLAEEERLFSSALPYGAQLPFLDGRLLGISEPARGDLAVVRLPYAREAGYGERVLDFFLRLGTGQTYRRQPEREMERRVVRRIVGLPGDTVRIQDFVAYVREPGSDSFTSELQLSPTRYEIVRPDLPDGWESQAPFGGTAPERTLGPNEYFVVADNRAQAFDSRHFGPITGSAILEKVVFRYWPMSRFGVPGN
jgi:signal peptidase I